MTDPVVAVTIGRSHYRRMFRPETLDALDRLATVIHHDHDEPAGPDALVELLPGVNACVTSWGVARFDARVLAAADRLGAVAHMGSSVKRLVSDGIWERQIRVTSAGVALARDVAETTLGLMIVGRKRIWPLGQHVREGGWRDSPTWDRWGARELSRSTIGIVGASNVGRRVIELLEPFETRILLTDPFVDPGHATELGVTLVDIDELVATADVVSLHCPANDTTRHLLDRRRLAAMRDGTVIVNTARGELIDEAALAAELESGRLFAFLDVTDPEPPALDSPLRRLDNVVITPHIAGCIEDCTPMGELAVEELRRYFAGEPAIYEIRPEMLDRIA